MRVAPDLIAAKPIKPLNRIANDGRAQMPDMHGFSDIGTSIINNDFARHANQLRASTWIGCDRFALEAKRLIGQSDI